MYDRILGVILESSRQRRAQISALRTRLSGIDPTPNKGAKPMQGMGKAQQDKQLLKQRKPIGSGFGALPKPKQTTTQPSTTTNYDPDMPSQEELAAQLRAQNRDIEHDKESARNAEAEERGRQRMKDNDAEKELNLKWGVGGEKPKRKYRWADLSDEEYEKYKKEMAQVRKTSTDPEAMADLDRSRRRMRAQKNLDKFTSFGLGAKLGSAIGSAMSQPLVKSKPPKKFM
jgi:hypothetical protein